MQATISEKQNILKTVQGLPDNTSIEEAMDNVEEIAKYISGDSTHYAQLFAIKVFDAVRRIESFPESGRIVPEIKQKNIREIILGNYRIIYRLKNDHAISHPVSRHL